MFTITLEGEPSLSNDIFTITITIGQFCKIQTSTFFLLGSVVDSYPTTAQQPQQPVTHQMYDITDR